MNNEKCDLIHPNGVIEKKMEVIDGYTIKYHANSTTVWSKGKMVNDKPDGYWEWYRPDGIIKRSGNFNMGVPIGEWITYDGEGKKYKTTNRPQNI